MFVLPTSLAALGLAAYLRPTRAWGPNDTPQYAQVYPLKATNVLSSVPPPSKANATTFFVPSGVTSEQLKAKPFHIYSDGFYNIIGPNPRLTLIASAGTDPLFHEATTWFPPTDEVFFVQNAGAKAAGTGLNKSAITQKISLAQAAAVAEAGRTGQVDVVTVDTDVINPNGGTNFKNGILLVGEGQGPDIAPAIYFVDPYTGNTTTILNNFFGRQFNSLNDIAVSPRNKELYFTDVTYGYVQDFRPAPGIQNQVYRFNYNTGMVRIAADGFDKPNGLTFSPDGKYVYVADTGIMDGFFGVNLTRPASIYRFTVQDDGTLDDRKTFAFIDSGVPDGVHCDSNGNVYAGCGDGVHVWDPTGLLLGKIYLGETSANFAFAGNGRMVICAETDLYYVEIAAEGAPITSYDYSNVG